MKSIKYIAFLFLVLLFSTKSFTQEFKGHILYIDPPQILGMYNSSINFAYFIDRGDTFDFSIDLGIILPIDLWGSSKVYGTGRKHGKGFELGLSPRYNLTNSYLGLSVMYSVHNYESNRLISQSNKALTRFYVS